MATESTEHFGIGIPDTWDSLFQEIKLALVALDSDMFAISGGVVALADPAGNGIVVRDSLGHTVARSLVQPGAGITVTNGSGVSGNLTLALADDLAAIEALSTTGFAKRTGTSTWTAANLVAGDIPDISATYGVVASPLSQFASTTSAQLASILTDESGTGGGFVRGVGGALSALTGLGIRSTASAFDLTIASSEVLTTGRTLSIVMNDLARTLTIAGNATISGTNTGDQTSVSGNAGTATALLNARTIGGVSFDGTANITVATATGGFTVSGGALALGSNDLTITGSLGTTGSRLTKGWFTDLQVTNTISGSITGNAATVTTNANLTGDVTSVGNAATIGAGKVTFSMVAAAAWDDDVTLAANSASKFATQHATKTYIDNLISGLKFKQDCRVASTANVSVSSAPSSIDGVTLSSGDRVLLKNQTSGGENGVYQFNGGGSALTRTTDGDASAELISATFPIREGTANADTWWTITNDTITVGTTVLTFTQTGGSGTYTNGAGITLTGNSFSIAAGAITNAMLAGSIASSKLVGTDIVTVGTLTAGATGAGFTVALSTSTITGTLPAAQMPALTGDISNSAGSLSTTIGAGKVTNSMLAGSIAYSKLSLTGAILNADLAGSIAYSKLSLTGAILNADLAGSIAATKLVGTDIVTLGTITTGVWNGTKVSELYGGTNQNSYATGDMLYASATNTLSKLAGVATGNVLISGGVTTAPSWGKVGLTTHVSGILPTANGGTGIAFFTAAGPTSARVFTFPDAAATIARTDAAQTFTGTQTYAGSNVPSVTDTYDLGSSSLLWRKGWLSELDAILFAQNTVSVIGGWLLIAKNEGLIPVGQAIGSGDTTIDFGQSMTVNDFVLFRAAGQVEYVKVISLSSGTRYNVTRDVDGSGANAWVAGSVYVVLGNTGDGRIELNSNSTPRTSVFTQGSTYNSQIEVLRMGDLNGNWGLSSATFGFAAGEYGTASKAWFSVDPTNGIRIGSNVTTRINLAADGSGFVANSLIAWDTSGNLTITGNAVIGGVTIGSGKMYIGTGTYNNTNTSFYVDSTGQMSLKDKFVWSGSALTISGTVTATAGTIGGWTLGATSLTSGTGATTVGVDSGGTNPAFYAGSATPGSAPFRVTQAGVLTSTSGTIGAFTIGATRISSANLYLDQAGQYLSIGSTPATDYLGASGIWLGKSSSAYKMHVGTVNAGGADGTGGTITHGGGYTIHTFTSSGTFVAPTGVSTVEYLVVAGGGSGGPAEMGGGGGGGGVKTAAGYATTGGNSYTVTVGAGGASPAYAAESHSGSNSVFDTITSTGGGKGGSRYATGPATGGSGGGGDFAHTTGAAASPAGQGSAGGNATTSANYGAGGGGGAGGVGSNGTTTVGGNGGVGLASSISGSSVYYGGGGGGSIFSSGTPGTGGNGGGGAGSLGDGVAGTANTGGGGGGGERNGSGTGGAGGSGIVIIRYLTPSAPAVTTGFSWDGTTFSIANGVMSMSGTSSSIAIGSTPPTSATAGTGLWIDRSGLSMLTSGLLTASIQSSGIYIQETATGSGILRFQNSSGALFSQIGFNRANDLSGATSSNLDIWLNNTSTHSSVVISSGLGTFDGLVIGSLGTGGISVTPNAMLDVRGSAVVTGGVVVGSPTGGNKGTGSINAVTVWRNGTSLDSVFEPAYKLSSLDAMSKFIEVNHHLPTIPTGDVNIDGSTNLGELTDRLWETTETHALYILQLHERIKVLESQLDKKYSRV